MRKVCGVDMSTGSLGQGLSAANGMAIVGKRKNKGYRVYCIVGDGEMQEGQIWEAVMAAAHYKLDNLTVFVDANRAANRRTCSRRDEQHPLFEQIRRLRLVQRSAVTDMRSRKYGMHWRKPRKPRSNRR